MKANNENDNLEKTKQEKNAEAVKRYRERHPERVKENNRKQYQKNPNKRKESHDKWFQKVKDTTEFKDKANALARKSYVTRSKKKILALTEGRVRPEKCDICTKGGKICFDHSHSTGLFRGWLCHHCNLILGHAKDNPSILRLLADYLEKGKTK